MSSIIFLEERNMKVQEVITYATKVIEEVKDSKLTSNSYLTKDDVQRFLDYAAKLPDKSYGDDDIAIMNELAIVASERAQEESPVWSHIGGHFLLDAEYAKMKKKRDFYTPKSYYNLQKTLADKGIAPQTENGIMHKYTKEELLTAALFIKPQRDKLFTYLGVINFMKKYCERDFNREIMSLPQERYLTIALFISQNEPSDIRLSKVQEVYDALSNQFLVLATPLMANSNINKGQLSSCFIDTMQDSLNGIYQTDMDLANVSKYMGGIGVYIGKVRAAGSSIRNIKGVASGTVPWIKKLNNTAVSVDQLGQRPGSIAVYLDVWHKDVMSFLDIKLNNGDERQRAHDIFQGLCIPDIFMERVDAREEFSLFDPLEVEQLMGYRLEDSYDEKCGEGTFRKRYLECENNPLLSRKTVPAIDIMKRVMRSQLETGGPFMFYRDEVNRKNPNKHAGMIYSSNLCSEIAQNMSVTEFESITLEDDMIVTRRRPGDFVVCNLASIHVQRCEAYGKATDDKKFISKIAGIAVRILDNSIDINVLPVIQATVTNNKYRGLGVGTLGWHHHLAYNNIDWESDEAVKEADKVYEKIAMGTIKASADLAKERGSYPMFEGSDWETGAYFTDRNYEGKKWDKLKKKAAKGMRNGYLMAVAPNSTTTLTMNTTASIDPIFKRRYEEENAAGKEVVIAPDLTGENYALYKDSAYHIDQLWSIKQHGKRARHIDQSASINIYVPKNVQASHLLNIHLTAWKNGVKTTYYVRNTVQEITECDNCSV